MGDDAYEPLGPPPAPPAAEDNYEPLGPPPPKPAEPAAPAEEPNNQYEPINFPNAPAEPPKIAKPEKDEKFVQKRLPEPAEEDEPTTDLNSQRKSKQKSSKPPNKSGKKAKGNQEKEPAGKSAEQEKADSVKSTPIKGKGKRNQKRSACNIACLVVSGIFAVVFLLIAIGAGVLLWKPELAKDWF